MKSSRCRTFKLPPDVQARLDAFYAANGVTPLPYDLPPGINPYEGAGPIPEGFPAAPGDVPPLLEK